MRIVTWNCSRGPWQKKVPALAHLLPDIAVIQECAKPVTESDTCLWFGDNARQGIAVLARPPYRISRHQVEADVPKFMFPVQVSGPLSFVMMVAWSKGGQAFPYVEGVVQGVRIYRSVFASVSTVLIGDLNSNVIWDDEHPAESNHSALTSLLSELGLVSAYHCFHDEVQGQESRPTYFFHWKRDRGFHIDYCFVPKAWGSHLQRVEVGTFEAWCHLSDHRPLLVEVATNVA